MEIDCEETTSRPGAPLRQFALTQPTSGPQNWSGRRDGIGLPREQRRAYTLGSRLKEWNGFSMRNPPISPCYDIFLFEPQNCDSTENLSLRSMIPSPPTTFGIADVLIWSGHRFRPHRFPTFSLLPPVSPQSADEMPSTDGDSGGVPGSNGVGGPTIDSCTSFATAGRTC